MSIKFQKPNISNNRIKKQEIPKKNKNKNFKYLQKTRIRKQEINNYEKFQIKTKIKQKCRKQ